MARERDFPLGAGVTLAQLDGDPHPLFHSLRAAEPVSWLPCTGGWLVTRHDLALAAMLDAVTFTVDDPRFSTAQVVGPSMLSLDGDEHARHRAPFRAPFRAPAVAARLAGVANQLAMELHRPLRDRGHAELRGELAGPLAAGTIARALGLGDETGLLLARYREIVASVEAITAGGPPTAKGKAAFDALRAALAPAIAGRSGGSLLASAAAGEARGASGARGAPGAPRAPGPPSARPLTEDEIAANAAVLLFGGIETTEGMVANAALELLRRPGVLRQARGDRAQLDRAIDESLRLEPAAAVIDRYATADTKLGGASIARGELVRISLAGANRDPAVFPDPDSFDPGRANLRRHLAFAQGPHVCVGVHLARIEARAALAPLLHDPPRLVAEPEVRGVVFRKPRRLDVSWG